MDALKALAAKPSGGIVFTDISDKFGESKAAPPELEGFSWCGAADGSRLFIFGGALGAGGESDVVFSFSPSGGWAEEARGGPSGRCGASLGAVGGRLFLFGGLSTAQGSPGWLQDLHVFDIESRIWTEVTPVEGEFWPSARDKSQMAVLGGKLYVYGGFGPEESETEIQSTEVCFSCRKDFCCFDPETSAWSQVTAAGGPSKGLSAHSLTRVGSSLVLFGGLEGTGKRGKACWVFSAGRWRDLSRLEGGPTPRSFHGAAALDARHLVIFGGRDVEDFELDDLYVLDVEKECWAEPAVDDDPGTSQPPSGRFGHALCLIGTPPVLTVFGGLADIDDESGAPDSVLTDLITADPELIRAACSFTHDSDANGSSEKKPRTE